ncbi:hypothetical protein E2C01_098437 [Portunus trituberculatus]|uniref:Uncharacterized protein n=1 Tax=Portunus trituberculatus TaxID=210409 RepID=A0A5B7JXU1_PORTR|nr:hypothetical protein [Portunus trituberculatus]
MHWGTDQGRRSRRAAPITTTTSTITAIIPLPFLAPPPPQRQTSHGPTLSSFRIFSATQEVI